MIISTSEDHPQTKLPKHGRTSFLFPFHKNHSNSSSNPTTIALPNLSCPLHFLTSPQIFKTLANRHRTSPSISKCGNNIDFVFAPDLPLFAFQIPSFFSNARRRGSIFGFNMRASRQRRYIEKEAWPIRKSWVIWWKKSAVGWISFRRKRCLCSLFL